VRKIAYLNRENVIKFYQDRKSGRPGSCSLPALRQYLEKHRSMDLQSLINGRLGIGLALGVGRRLPPSVGYPLASFFADRVASRRRSALVKAVRANQWVLSGGSFSAEQLDQVVRQTFRNTAHCQFDLYHNLHDPDAALKLMKQNPLLDEAIQRSMREKMGLVIVGLHMSNFDFVFQSAALRGWRGLAITYPQPGGGYQWQNDLRRESGLEIIPGTMDVLRKAIRRLREGEMVVTGIDRPQLDSKYCPRFFGRPATMPVLHIMLALKTNAPVVVTAAIMRPDGIYQFLASDFIVMQPHSDRHTEILLNAERVLSVAEGFIRQAPQQWAMFYPVWPEALEEMPE
jgi:phosphatidylinositol dimannoside acyltransferase